MTKFGNFDPSVELVNAFSAPYDNAVATARSCYSSKIIYDQDVRQDENSKARRDAIAQSIFLAGHHTTLQHSTFQFAIAGISRHCIWSFLHSHPFYNSEQVSQRYVAVSKENFVVPPMSQGQHQQFLDAVTFLMQAYETLQELLRPTVISEYQRLFPGRNLEEKRWVSAIKKRCQETARYVLPLATGAHLYHTISGLTLLRYVRLSQSFDAPKEQKVLIDKMVEAVRAHDPDFFKLAQDPMPLEQTPEYQFFTSDKAQIKAGEGFAPEFDQDLGGYVSKLVDYKKNGQRTMARSVRHMLGTIEAQLSDEEAIDLVMNPAKNCYLSETMNLSQYTKLQRAMVHPHFTFSKKISHTADSQDQRHRTVPASRPVLARMLSAQPDYIVPELIRVCAPAFEFYEQTMKTLWNKILRLLQSGLPLDDALYLLPNAFPIRFEESGALIDWHHKWVHRLCYTAQEEIWKSSKEEVEQVQEIYPLIGKFLRAPCSLRQSADRKPFCPEGERFCGVPVWNKELKDYQRIL